MQQVSIARSEADQLRAKAQQLAPDVVADGQHGRGTEQTAYRDPATDRDQAAYRDQTASPDWTASSDRTAPPDRTASPDEPGGATRR